MLLEDFFTLTEMKDGLATLARVEELLSVMQNHNDCYSNNLGDAARQWATVASILAATENKDCLNHFVQLNGLLFLNHWLQEAQKWSGNYSDFSVEELITALLGALDRLPVDKEKASSSGIGSTIKQLLCHRGHNIRKSVTPLLDKWDPVEDSDLECQNAEEHGITCNEEAKASTKTGTVAENGQPINLGPKVSPSDEEPSDGAKRYSNISLAGTISDVKLLSDQISPYDNSNSSDANVVSGEIGSYPGQESLCIAKESACPAAGVPSADSSISRGGIVDYGSDVSGRKDTSDSPKEVEIEVNMEEFSPCNAIKKEICRLSEMEASFHKEDTEAATDVDDNPKPKVNKGTDFMASCASSKPAVDANMSETDGRSEMVLGYCEIDALEVARQVAIEVEREVVDYREPFCSSPEEMSPGKSLDSSSPDIVESNPVSEQLNENESPSTKDISEDSLRNRKRTSEDVDSKDACKPESPKSSLVQESAGNADKNTFEFDLNEDVCLEEADCLVVSTASQNIKFSTPIPVAASKGTPGFPLTPLHFPGAHGWRGSAATSAFRPASPWRTSDGEKTVSCPKQKPNFLRIDLNVTEGEDDIAADRLDKQTPASSSIPSRESSMEVSSRRAERLKLDLNRIGDEDTLPNQVPFWRPHLHNANLSLSPASSSTSRQPSTRDFDLNDNPSFFDACGSNGHSKPFKETSTYRNNIVDDSVITIMDSRVPVERKSLINETLQPFLGNVLGMGPAISGRGPAPYLPMPPPAFGYNGLVMGPAISIPPTFCGPGSIPYLVDPRGATIIPQMLGSVGFSNTPSARAPFAMSVAGAPSGLNVIGVTRPSMDLNSDTIPSEGEGRTVGSYRQFFLQGSSGLMEEPLRSASQPAGSGMALKRKEPDCGWEPCTFGYKQVTSWQ